MIIFTAAPADVQHVIETMRPESAREALASRPDNDLPKLGRELAALRGWHRLLVLCDDEGVRVALVGLLPVAPGRAMMLFAAKAAFPKLAFAVRRWWWNTFVPEDLAQFRRVEFTGSAPGSSSARWLESLGFVCEGLARAYGKSGEDFGHWAWINPASGSGAVDGRAVALRSLQDTHSRARGSADV